MRLGETRQLGPRLLGPSFRGFPRAISDDVPGFIAETNDQEITISIALPH
jgi:hypothetical protein